MHGLREQWHSWPGLLFLEGWLLALPLLLWALGTVSAREVVAGGHYCCDAVTQMEEVETKAPTPASQPASQPGNNTCQGDDDEAAARARPGTTGTAMRVGTLASLEEKCMPCRRPPWERRPELKQAETMRQAGDRCRGSSEPRTRTTATAAGRFKFLAGDGEDPEAVACGCGCGGQHAPACAVHSSQQYRGLVSTASGYLDSSTARTTPSRQDYGRDQI